MLRVAVYPSNCNNTQERYTSARRHLAMSRSSGHSLLRALALECSACLPWHLRTKHCCHHGWRCGRRHKRCRPGACYAWHNMPACSQAAHFSTVAASAYLETVLGASYMEFGKGCETSGAATSPTNSSRKPAKLSHLVQHSHQVTVHLRLQQHGSVMPDLVFWLQQHSPPAAAQ